MPIRKTLRRWYGKAHRRRAQALKEAAGWRCQGAGCERRHGDAIVREDGTTGRVVLTLAHLNHKPWDNRAANLRVLCQRCHLAHDQAEHVRNAAATRARKTAEAHDRAGQLPLLGRR
jgi:hypothetical protein